MSISVVSIKVIPYKAEKENESSVKISAKLMKQLRIERSEILKISIGKTLCQTNIVLMESQTNEIQIAEQLLHKFSLPIQNYRFQSFYFRDLQTLWLGPVIGLVSNFSVKEEEKANFGSIHAFCSELHQGLMADGGFFYVFKLDQFPNQGYYLDSEEWLKGRLPVPDCIYNRIHSRKMELSEPFKKFREQLQHLSIPIFNDRFLSKWEVHELLNTEPLLVQSIPETTLFSKENFYDFVQKYETVFIKPVHGSQGRNILKVFTIGENDYSFQTSFSPQSADQGGSYSLEELYWQIKDILQKRRQIFLIQQGIPLLSWDSRTVDFRVLCHKNSLHNWKVTSTISRVGGQNEVVSNLARGGTVMHPVEALCTFWEQNQAVKILESMRELSIGIANAISRCSEGITGELGIDMGVDQTGKPWLIEVNMKPSKSFEDGLGKIRPSAKAIIRYCSKLAIDSMIEKEFE